MGASANTWTCRFIWFIPTAELLSQSARSGSSKQAAGKNKARQSPPDSSVGCRGILCTSVESLVNSPLGSHGLYFGLYFSYSEHNAAGLDRHEAKRRARGARKTQLSAHLDLYLWRQWQTQQSAHIWRLSELLKMCFQFYQQLQSCTVSSKKKHV